MSLQTLISKLDKLENYNLYEGLSSVDVSSIRLWESAGYAIREAALTTDQIQQLFQQAEQGATTAGGNRTLIGQGKDAATAVNQAWEDLKTKVQNSGPIKNVDAAYDNIIAKIEAGLGGPDNAVNKVIQKYRAFAKERPIAQGLIYSALIAAAGISGAGLGGAAVLGLLKMTDKLLQGQKFSSAAYSGAKTGAMAYGASKIVDMIKGGNQPSVGANTDDIQKGLSSDQAFQDRILNKYPPDQGYTFSTDGKSLQALDAAGNKVWQGNAPLKTMDMKTFVDLTNNGQMATPGISSGSVPLDHAYGTRPGENELVRTNYSGTNIAGQPVIPGQPLSTQQLAVMKLSMDSGNTYSPEIMAQYNQQVPQGSNITAPPNSSPPSGIVPRGSEWDAEKGTWVPSKALYPDAAPQVTAPTAEVPPAQSVADTSSITPPRGAKMSPEYLNQVINGEITRPMINADQAKAALDWQSQNGGQYKGPSWSQMTPDQQAAAAAAQQQQAADAAQQSQNARDYYANKPANTRGIRESYHDKPATLKMWLDQEARGQDPSGVVLKSFVVEGILDTVKNFGKNLTTKITADKLNSAWKKSGSPTESDAVFKVLQDAGVASDVISKIYSDMSIPEPAGRVEPTIPLDNASAAPGSTVTTSSNTTTASPTINTQTVYQQVKTELAKLKKQDKIKIMNALKTQLGIA
jgi:hypothetical protein